MSLRDMRSPRRRGSAQVAQTIRLGERRVEKKRLGFQGRLQFASQWGPEKPIISNDLRQTQAQPRKRVAARALSRCCVSRPTCATPLGRGAGGPCRQNKHVSLQMFCFRRSHNHHCFSRTAERKPWNQKRLHAGGGGRSAAQQEAGLGSRMIPPACPEEVVAAGRAPVSTTPACGPSPAPSSRQHGTRQPSLARTDTTIHGISCCVSYVHIQHAPTADVQLLEHEFRPVLG
ncbi:hypothetical protein BT67DRAFT_318223 [Trichocladium antarcticum]|uniref:Uncharacterized protein n=1 Tax=Trichocladium antarcticum TaxID=1450529 RepID=A0AAN6UKS4_9PEZI|nr:hypothetical protein BT67DRAFT_318223 [Trichocladium antarcticum]